MGLRVYLRAFDESVDVRKGRLYQRVGLRGFTSATNLDVACSVQIDMRKRSRAVVILVFQSFRPTREPKNLGTGLVAHPPRLASPTSLTIINIPGAHHQHTCPEQ